MDLHLNLATERGPLKARFEHALRAAVRDLPPGTRLPPTRALATELGVSRGVVADAYAQLAAEGYLLTRRGGGTFVARTPAPPLAATAAPRTTARPPRYDLRPALPALDGGFRPIWARALGRALKTTPDARFGYPDPRGEPELRDALAGSLARRRGTRATPGDIRVTGGLGPSLPALWRLLATRGVTRVAIEDPCWPRLRRTLTDAGLTPVPIAVDAKGIRVEDLPDDAGAVFVTPAHQYPTGAVLDPDRRARLIEWARAHRALVLEDDYDAEFRYDRQPVGSLQGLAPDVVIHAGSTSKTLAPGLRLGWLILPSSLQATLPGTPPVLDQLALADLIERGDFDRHLRRYRRLYASRRAALLEAVAAHLPEATVSGAAAGLHAVLHIEHAEAIADAARARGVELDAFDGALIAGYANLPESQADAAVREIKQSVGQLW